MVICSSSCLGDDGIIALLSLWLAGSILLTFFICIIFGLLKSLDSLEVEILIFERQVHLFKFVRLGFDLDLKWHQSIVEQPIL